MGKKDGQDKSKSQVDQYRKRLGNREKHQVHGRYKPRELKQKQIPGFQPSRQFQNIWLVAVIFCALIVLGYVCYSFSVIDYVVSLFKM